MSPPAAAPFEFSAWTDMRPAPGSNEFSQRYAEVLDEARLAEALGYRSFWTTEVHGIDDGYLGAQLPLLAAVAAVTSRIRLVTSVLLLPFYNWRQTLEATVVVDLLSQGRMELGVGAGAYEREFDLFGVDYRRRGRLMEEGIRFLRQGLVDGQLPDGPDGALVPLRPLPVQQRLPLLVGGLAQPAVDRAVRLGDGHIAYDYEAPETMLPSFWEERLQPALERESRSLDDFHFAVALPLWVSDDPERAWAEDYGPAFTYQQRKYVEWYAAEGRDGDAVGGMTPDAALVGTPEDVAGRLMEMWRRAPWHELGFFYRLPGISHERALAHMELVNSRLVPELARLAAADARAGAR